MWLGTMMMGKYFDQLQSLYCKNTSEPELERTKTKVNVRKLIYLQDDGSDWAG